MRKILFQEHFILKQFRNAEMHFSPLHVALEVQDIQNLNKMWNFWKQRNSLKSFFQM